MRKLSQTEELAKILASRARHHLLTPEQVSRAMEEQEYDVAGLDALYEALEAHGIRDGILADLGCGTGELTLMLTQAGYDLSLIHI